MTVETKSGKNTAVLFGFINGGVSILFTVLLYLGGVDTFVSPVAYLGLVLPVVVCVIGALLIKKHHGGFLEFRDALKATFIILVIGSLIVTIFQFILFNYIDVPFREALAQVTAQKAEQLMHKLGMPEDQIDKAVEETLNTNNYTVGRLMLGFVFSCIGSFVVALIISAIIKRKPTVFENSFNQ